MKKSIYKTGTPAKIAAKKKHIQGVMNTVGMRRRSARSSAMKKQGTC